MDWVIEQAKNLKGKLTVPGDKSISHRAVMLGAFAEGMTEVENFLMGADCLSTIKCLEALGVEFDLAGRRVKVSGVGKNGFKEPAGVLDAGNSGTTMRLLSGLLAGQPFYSVLTGDSSLRNRPMLRVVQPLREMGACIDGRKDGQCAPLTIRGGGLQAIDYHSPIASAQVKSAILLSGLYAEGVTTVTEPKQSRNHTELMLAYFGADINTKENTAVISGSSKLTGQKIIVPGDISSAAFFIVAGIIIPNSEITICNVGINPTRSGIISVLQAMGGQIFVENRRLSGGELMADITVKSSSLKGTVVQGDMIPVLIDEIPVLAVAAAVAEGKTLIKDAGELKVKESDRIATTCSELRKLGANIEELSDGMVVSGSGLLTGSAKCVCYDDHRIAMALAVGALKARGQTTITGVECVDISFPGFYQILRKIANS